MKLHHMQFPTGLPQWVNLTKKYKTIFTRGSCEIQNLPNNIIIQYYSSYEVLRTEGHSPILEAFIISIVWILEVGGGIENLKPITR